MNSLGAAALFVAFLAALYGSAVSLWAALSGRRDAARSAEASAYAVLVLVTLASAALLRAFLAHDFSLAYVYEYSSRALSWAYCVTAFWAGQEGSLLLWALLLAAFSATAVLANRHRHRDLMPWVLHVLMVNASFFLLLLNFVSDPFAEVPGRVPPDGYGLNPLLQNPGMIWHPPTLFVGYVGLTIPYAFAMASLLAGRSDSGWILSTRLWTVISWFFLGVGILLGAEWAYVELGWGGYWAWDPVENASLMPWLTATALMHSVMVQERRGMMKVWNVALVVLTYFLVIFGTFITRSGVISSVHAFGKSSIGTFFLVFMIATLAVSFAILAWRWRSLAAAQALQSVLSRESGFLLNNVFLTAMAVIVFMGTTMPVFSELLAGEKVTLGVPFYNRVNVPIGVALLALIGICPLLGWKRTTPDRLRRNALVPAAALLLGGGAAWAAGLRAPAATLVGGASAMVLAVVAAEVLRGASARRRAVGENVLVALARQVWGNRRRYGGYIVHLGMAVVFLGLSGASLTQETSVTLAPREKAQLGRYTLTYISLTQAPAPDRVSMVAKLRAERDGVAVGTLMPERRFYNRREDKPTSEVSILTSWREDLYVALLGYEKDGRASFRILVNPLVPWLWAGGFVIALGTLVAVWPGRRPRAAEGRLP